MSITSQVAKTGPFLIAGLPQVIPCGFPFQDESEIQVLNLGASGTTYDPALVLTLGSDYSVTGGGYNSANEMQLGSITVVSTGTHAVAVGDQLVILRNVPINQTQEFITTGPLTLQQLEQGLDKQATISQELSDTVGLSLRFEKSEFLDGTLLKSLRANKYLAFDANGSPIFPSGSDSPIGDVSFNTVTATGSTAAITLANRFAEVVNVKDFGALGNGSANDTASILAASVVAVSRAGALYFPAGTYMTDSLSITGANGLTIYGDGMGVSILKGRSPTRILSVWTSTHVNVYGLTFDGQCVTRTAGQQAVTLDASKSSFHDCEILNSGEFAFYAGDQSAVTDLSVCRNYIHDCYADGIHFDWVTGGLIANNLILRVDDDCIALYYNGIGIANQIEVIGNYMTARNDLGTTTGRGIAVVRAFNCLITGNYMRGIKQSGIWLNNESGSRVQNVVVSNNNVVLACISSGYGIAAYATTDCVLANNTIQNPIAATACIDIADWQGLTIIGGSIIQENNIFSRGIHAEESAGWAASWDRLFISGVTISMIGASTEKCIYLNPNAASTMNTVIIQNVIGYQVTAGDYINVNAARTGTLAKIVNNTFAGAGTTTTPAASAGVFIIANNN